MLDNCRVLRNCHRFTDDQVEALWLAVPRVKISVDCLFHAFLENH